MFVLPRGQAAPGFGYDVGKGGVLLALHSASLPFVGKILSDFDTLDPLVYPFLAITQPSVIGNSLFNRQFWILNLVNTIGCDLGHPLLEWFCLGRRNRLDESEQLLLIGYICLSHLSVSSDQLESVTICNGFISLVLQTLFQYTPIKCRIFTLCQYRYYVNYREIPSLSLIVPHSADSLLFKKLYFLLLCHCHQILLNQV